MNSIFDGFFTGINYWGSKNATHMWRDYDSCSIERDMKLLHDAGVTVLRVFPNWEDFQPITAFTGPGGRAYEYGMHGKPCPDTVAGKAGVDEVMCERFEDFCDIADKFGMKIMVALLTGHMSFANLIPQALTNLDVTADPIAIRWEIRYIKYLVTRFSKIKNIVAWDLGNEVANLRGPKTTKDDFHIWTTLLANTIKSCDATRPILSGVGGFEIEQGVSNLFDLSECCDVNTVHGYNIFDTAQDPLNTMKPILDYIFKCKISEDIGNMPTFIQEFGAIGYTNCSEKTESEFYRACALSALAHGCHGVMYWCAFDQGHLTFPPYNWNNIGSDYGFYDKNYRAKPIVEENLRVLSLINAVGGNLPKHKTNCTIIVPRDEGKSQKDMLRATYMLAKRANLEASFAYAINKIPSSEVYIMPSVKYDKAITNTRLLELLDHVSKGAALYISLSSAYFRRIAEFAGVCINNRIDRTNETHIKLGKDVLPVLSNVEYDITEGVGEVLARNEKGMPVFVKNKYGKGSIYVLFAPLEEYLAQKGGAFYEEATADYEKIYACFANNAKDKKLFFCNSKFINCTEHYADDGSVYIFAINYSNRKQCSKLNLPDNYCLTGEWGSKFENGEIILDPCDGILLKAKKI